jgi:uncharacterized delta-60 repeat protein
MSRIGRTGFVVVAMIALTIPPVLAAPGDLDPTFGVGGIVYTSFFRHARASAVALQPDGKIVAVGTYGIRDDKLFALARYLTDGTLDATFGGGDGKVITNITRRSDLALDVAIQTDGKLVVVGRSGGKNGQFGVVRYESDGSLDASFGGGGIVVTDFSAGDDIASAVALQADGRIVVAGTRLEGFALNSRFAVARYLVDGTLDQSFSLDGKIATNFTRGRDSASGVAIQADGKIVAAGRAGGAGGRFALVRYKPGGTRDGTFAGDGKVMTDFTRSDDEARDVAIQTDGKIVAVGEGGPFGRMRFVLARYTDSGALDQAFSGDGRALGPPLGSAALGEAVALQADGKTVVSGLAWGGASSCETVAVVSRFSTDGAIDASFGTSGTAATSYEVANQASDVVIQPDGRIVAVGAANFCTSKFTFVVLRYLGA